MRYLLRLQCANMLDNGEMKRRREKLGLTMDAAAQLAGFNGRQQWYYIESGSRSDIQLSTLQRIASALQCDPCDLLAKEARAKAKKG